MLKKKFPEVDLHMNSNIVIHMDEKARLKSNYMKKHNENVRNIKINALDAPAAGARNFLRFEPNADQKHLNPTRRRILNDFISRRNDFSLEAMANRNKSDLLKNPAAGSQDSRQYYDYGGNLTQVGPANRPGKLQQM